MASPRADASTTALRVGVLAAGLGVSLALVWGLRSLVLPVAVGCLLAYVCQPLIGRLERFELGRGLTVAILVVAMIAIGLFLLSRVRSALPDEVGGFELRVRALHNLNRRYRTAMGLEGASTEGNRLYRFAGEDLDPLVDQVVRTLALSPEEHARFLAARLQRSPDPGSDRLILYDQENERTLEARGLTDVRPSGATREAPGAARRRGPLAALGETLSTWVVAPVVFFFVLRDASRIKCALLRLVPNRLFEPTLAVFSDLDRALGGYVRGIFLESAFLGISVGMLLRVLGVPVGWAILVALVAGAANPIPYIGSAVALLGGLSYVVVADEVHPLLPIRPESAAAWMVVGIVLIEVLKNTVFEPIVLGESVDVHPLVVLIGVLGGGLMFGLVGLLLALPTITLVKTLVSSGVQQLRAYELI